MRLLALAALFAAPVLAQEPVTLSPGHPDLEVATLTPETTTYALNIVEPPIAIGTVTEGVLLEGDVLTVVTTSDLNAAALSGRDSTRMAWPSLAPLSHDATSGDDTGTVLFADGAVSGSYGPEGRASPFSFDLSQPVFPAAALGYVIRALPLEPEYRAVVPTFSASERFKEVLLTVVGPEDVTLPNGTEASAVAVRQAGGGGMAAAGPVIHYVDPGTRALLMTVATPQGSTVQITPLSAEELAASRAEAAAAAAAAEATRIAGSSNRLTPGHPDLIAVGPQSTVLTVQIVEPMVQDFGTITTTESLEDGRLTFTSDVQIPQAGQNQQDTTVVAYPSLEPVSRVEVKPGETERTTFANGSMVSVVTEGGAEAVIEGELEGAFGPGVTRHLVRSLPFADGYVASFDQINGDGEISTSTLTVTGQEPHTLPDGSETTVWNIVEQEEGSPDYEYLVDAETRDLLRVAFTPQPGVRVEMTAE
ncbi:hypothetical protein [Rubrivirga sp.]|uniref:DUF3108 domain-containing protein n=1 Tax=Rubrivirga sp. TaxID=1885344 RepID=UPI003C75FBC9